MDKTLPQELRFDAASTNQWKMVGDRLQVMATVSRVVPEGLPYRRKDGSIIREIVTADELFNSDSVDTARLAPVTFGHPKTGLVKNDWKSHSVGASGNSVVIREDEGYLDLVLTIGDKEVIDAAMAAKDKGKNLEISAGYTTIVKPKGDKFFQTKRRYDHFAVLPESSKGRAGEDVSLHMDAEDINWAVQVNQDSQDKNKNEFTIAKLDEATIDLIHEAISLKMYEASKEIKTKLANELNTTVSSVAETLDRYFETPSDEFVTAAAKVLDIDLDQLISTAKLSRDLQTRRQKSRTDEMKKTTIVVNNRAYDIASENADAADLSNVVTELINANTESKTKIDSLEAKLNESTTSSEALQKTLDETNEKLTESTQKVDELNSQLEESKTKLDSDQVSLLMSECIDTWSSTLPTLIKADTAFKPNYSASPVEIKRMYLKAVRADLAENDLFKNDDYVNGLFTALKPQSNEVTVAKKNDQMSDERLQQLMAMSQYAGGNRRVDSSLTPADEPETKEDDVSIDDIKNLYSFDAKKK